MTTDATPNVAVTPASARRAKTTAAGAPMPAAAAPAPVPTSAAKPTSKADTVIKLLMRTTGATPTELIAATDWRPHSLRAFLSGLRKKGRSIVRDERKGGGYAYRIVVAPAPVATTESEVEPPVRADSGGSDSAAGA